MTRQDAVKILWQYDVNFEPHPAEDVMHAIDMAIEALEQIESGRYVKGECNRCHKEYGTLGCCTTVSNHWVYSCKEGMAQYAEALEQEPKEDCISRADTLEILHAMANVDKDNAKVYSKIYSQIKDAPSVVPKRGKWLDYLEDGLKWECSECDSKFTTPWHYCPNCGTRMGSDEE